MNVCSDFHLTVKNTQHLITILPRKKATVENFKRIAAAIKEVTGYGHFLIHNRAMDDSVLNNGQGCEWYRLDQVRECIKYDMENPDRFFGSHRPFGCEPMCRRHGFFGHRGMFIDD